MVASSRTWHRRCMLAVADVWSSAADREAVGRDGERYEWLTLHVTRSATGDSNRYASSRSMTRRPHSPTPRSGCGQPRAGSPSRTAQARLREALGRRAGAADVDGTVGCYANTFVFDDRRRLTGDPVSGMAELRAATQRIFEQYSQFDWRTLAVRGTCLHLAWSRWSDDAGNETGYLHVREVGDDGRFTYDARFDADDFDAAYRELERRYYAGEGAAFAEAGALITDYTIAYNEGDFDKLFGELTTPGMQFENRSRSVFPIARSTNFVPASRNCPRWSPRREHGVRPSAGCRRVAASVALSVRRLARRANATAGRRSTSARSVTVGSLRCVSSNSTTRTQAFAYAEERIRADQQSTRRHEPVLRISARTQHGNAGTRRRQHHAVHVGSSCVRRSSTAHRRPHHRTGRVPSCFCANPRAVQPLRVSHSGGTGRAPQSQLEPLVGCRRERDVVPTRGRDRRRRAADLRGPLRRGRLRRRVPRAREALLGRAKGLSSPSPLRRRRTG